MTNERVRPAFTGDERVQLTGWLELQRRIIHWKCEGLSDSEAHRVVIPTSPLMTVAGIVSHLRWTENLWFEVLFLGRPATGPQFGDDDGDMRVDGVPLAELLDAYRNQCVLSDRIIADHPLDRIGTHPDFAASQASLRWMLTHMVEETARHAGHLDLIRELLDSTTGYY